MKLFVSVLCMTLSYVHAFVDMSIDASAFGLPKIQFMTNGEVQTALINLAASATIPADVSNLSFSWKSTAPASDVSFTFSAQSFDESLFLPPYLSVGNGGPIGVTETTFDTVLPCVAPGTAEFNVLFTFTKATDGAAPETFELDLTFKKLCIGLDQDIQDYLDSINLGLPSYCASPAFRPPTNGIDAKEGKVVGISSLNAFGVLGFSEPRVEGILSRLTETSDIIVLQEVFYEEDINLFESVFNSKFSPDDIEWNMFNKGLGNATASGVRSGLFMASKYEILQCRFTPLTQGSALGSLATKGVGGWLIDIHDGKMVYLFGTHFDVGSAGDEWQDIQLDESREFIRESLWEAEALGYSLSDIAVLFVGDFNIKGDIDTGEPTEDTVAALGDALSLANDLEELRSQGYLECREESQNEECPNIPSNEISDKVLRGIDYGFTYNTFDSKTLLPLPVTTWRIVEECCGTDNFLADHPTIEVQLVFGERSSISTDLDNGATHYSIGACMFLLALAMNIL